MKHKYAIVPMRVIREDKYLRMDAERYLGIAQERELIKARKSLKTSAKRMYKAVREYIKMRIRLWRWSSRVQYK